MANPSLVLWDIDRTLLYVGDFDRQVYRETFAEVVGRPAERMPARGTGVTMPLAIRELLLANGVPAESVPDLLPAMVELLPKHLSAYAAEMKRTGTLMPGAEDALRAVQTTPGLIPTVVTGNLKPNAMIKLRAFELDAYVYMDIGGFASDDPDRPALVRIAQSRAQTEHGVEFTRANTVIIGDSLEDVRTGLLGGAPVIGVASGKTTSEELSAAGADIVLPDLRNLDDLLAAIATLTA
ncbi:haloacid dehalogenase-like hydrolase [Streptomyces sp. H10-C2]|uniref:HAD family hydrolase n=1 Tax=unclassified Streptomyces TaxID=2593676 RepID=UPI0024B94F9A|nr:MULTISPECIES: haloacid dehalogenase-like hydrolase [unclassified Streptomyces]MDJ0344949.1 haloacid dehalogenase-like hydrolase [Streptomyces sp. PH10-H1]MDJ0373793.1 haloacid dehalogenase-like hydrolase [Streptomyces sp. H10-C2]